MGGGETGMDGEGAGREGGWFERVALVVLKKCSSCMAETGKHCIGVWMWLAAFSPAISG